MAPVRSIAHILAVMRTATALSLPVLLASFAAVLAAPTEARAADVKRRGVQFEGTFGASLCIPGKGDCKSADTVSGKTGPSFGMGLTLGFRPLRSLMIGGAYNLGFFNPDYRDGAADVYKRAYQNSFFGVIRGIIPIWRVDIGLEIAPGWSRQVFKLRDSSGLNPVDRTFSQGFALKTAPMVDFYVTRNVFVGAKVDFIFNFHKQVCSDLANGDRLCVDRGDSDNNQASIHQMLVGFHVGGTF